MCALKQLDIAWGRRLRARLCRLQPAFELIRWGLRRFCEFRRARRSRRPARARFYALVDAEFLVLRSVTVITHASSATMIRRINRIIAMTWQSRQVFPNVRKLCRMRLVAEYFGSVCRPMSFWRVTPCGQKLVDALRIRKRVRAWPNRPRWSAMKTSIPVEVSNRHFNFMPQAAVSGLGVAGGPHARDDNSGQLVAPYGFVESGNHNCFFCRGERANDPRIDT